MPKKLIKRHHWPEKGAQAETIVLYEEIGNKFTEYKQNTNLLSSVFMCDMENVCQYVFLDICKFHSSSFIYKLGNIKCLTKTIL